MSGALSVTVIAGNLKPAGRPVHDTLGQQFEIEGTNARIHITPETAKQWISELETLTKEGN